MIFEIQLRNVEFPVIIKTSTYMEESDLLDLVGNSEWITLENCLIKVDDIQIIRFDMQDS